MNNDVNDASLLSSSTTTGTMDKLLLFDDPLSSLFQCLPMNNPNFPDQQQVQFPTYNIDNNNVYFDLFNDESQQLKIADSSQPSSSQVMLHYNHPFIVQPFTGSDEPHIVMHQQQQQQQQQLEQQEDDINAKKRKKSLSVVKDELQVHEKKKVKRKRKKRVNPANKNDAGDVDPDAPPKPKRITGLNKPLILSDALQTIMEGAIEVKYPIFCNHTFVLFLLN